MSTQPTRPVDQERVLVLAPTEGDAALTRTFLTGAGFACHVCLDLESLCPEISAGAGAVLLTEEALAEGKAECLVEVLRQQPPWSDLPILLLTTRGADSPLAVEALDLLGNVTVLERPVRVTTLISSLRAALRARCRQYELRKLIGQLREADRKKDHFLAILAHELRNPLAPISHATHYLQLKGPVEPDLRNARDIIERQLRQLTHLVDELLDVSRITQGKITLQRERVSLGVVLTSAVESSRPLIERAGHELTVTLPPEPLFVEGDLARLSQVFANLLTNAAKYTDRGGRIQLAAERQRSEALVRVKDNGIGIPPEHLPGVFNMFSQVAPALERSQGGLGIGLALVKSLVEMHQGRVMAQSDGPGRGSEFIVRLPLLVDAPPADMETPGTDNGAPRSPPSKCRVVVADDNVDSALSFAMLLSSMGHEVRKAHDGAAAVALAESFRPDVMFLDIGMPKLNGYEAARRIRQQPWARTIVLCALTGWGQEEDKRRAADAGFDHHFTKPVDPAAVESVLAGKKCSAA
jgi:signal transduction histidine kinase/CheY-like chemotaxis protein